MAKNIKNPKVRFKGFTEDWSYNEVGVLLEERNIQSPKSPEYPLMAFIANEGVVPKGDRYNREFLVNDQANKKYKQTEYGDFIYSSNNLETGSIGLNNYGKASISPVYSIFQRTSLGVPNFLGNMLVRKQFVNDMLRWRQGVVYGQWRIHESDFVKIKISYPSKPEQKKIGDFFKQITQSIKLRQVEFEKLVRVKKSMLQKMFPKEGADIPEIRFNEYTGSWIPQKLIKLAVFNPKSNLPDTIKYVDLGSVIGTEMTGYREMDISEAPSRAQRLARQGDLFYQTVRPYQKNNFLFEKPDDNYVFSTGYAQLRPEIDGRFLLSLVQNNCFIQSVMIKCTGTSYPAISPSDLADIKVFIPENPEERLEIGVFFKELDNLINLNHKELKKLKELKKAYSEKMFA